MRKWGEKGVGVNYESGLVNNGSTSFVIDTDPFFPFFQTPYPT